MSPSKDTRFAFRSNLILDPAREESWLEQQARNGWHLKSANIFGYSLRRGMASKIAYRLDFRLLSRKQLPEYLSLFADAGWEHVCGTGMFIYFRRGVHGGPVPEIYSDRESLIGMYRRLLFFCSLFLCYTIFNLYYSGAILSLTSASLPHLASVGVQVTAATGLALSIVRMLLIIRTLRKGVPPTA